MPQLGESVHEGTISRWLVSPGDRVVEFEPMLEVETDKVDAEVPSPVTGVLKEILAGEGQTVPAGAEIALVEVDSPHAAFATGAQTARSMTNLHKGLASSPVEATPTASGGAGTSAPSRPLSPGVLRLAEEQGVDLADVQGSGTHGRITAKDVREYVKVRASALEASQAQQDSVARSADPLPPSPAPLTKSAFDDEVLPLGEGRRRAAQRMVLSKTSIPHAWQTHEVDMSGVTASLNAHRERFLGQEGFALTYLPYVIAAVAAALREHPLVNSSLTQDHVVIHREVNIGITLGAEETPLVPTIKRADELSVVGVARALDDLNRRARTNDLLQADCAGATFTVSTSGGLGTAFGYSIINPGEAATLEIGAVIDRPVAVTGMLAIRPMIYLSLSIDHRVLDGLHAAKFLVACRRWLEGVGEDTRIA